MSVCTRCTPLRLFILILFLWHSAGPVKCAQQNDPDRQPDADLTKMSLEDLMNVEVSSVSRREEALSKTASAVFVITRKEIAGSGVTNIPDLLRMVPGIQVAQINASTWAISARGLDERFSDKLMVMLDGRSLYTPTFGGVYWDGVDLPLEDIDRIEVIRGPGGSAWGSNAVDGVINIITRKASETQGGLVVAGGGNIDQGFGTVQYGGRLNPSTDYRVFTKYFNDAQFGGTIGPDGSDGWHVVRAGFRADYKASARDQLSFQGDIYTGDEGQIIPQFQSIANPVLIPIAVSPGLSGAYIQTSWERQYSADSDTQLQVSFDRYHRAGLIDDARSTVDVDFQHHFLWSSRHEIVWGLAYSDSGENITGNLTVSVTAPQESRQLFSGFFQDEIALIPDRLSLTLGSKFEHNQYTGVGVMPTARVAWNWNTHQMVWAAVSRGLRTPATFDTAVVANTGGYIDSNGTPIVFRLSGNPAVHNEEVVAYEAGYRSSLSPRFSLDLATYYNQYHDLVTTDPLPPFVEDTPPPVHIVDELLVGNLMHGQSRGVEGFATWKVTDHWTLVPAYSLEQIHLGLDPASRDSDLDPDSVVQEEQSTPRHWARLESRWNIQHHWDWNLSAGFVDRLPAQGVPSYTRVDTRLARQLNEHLQLELVGQNLLENEHLEFVDLWGSLISSQAKRSGFARLTWHF